MIDFKHNYWLAIGREIKTKCKCRYFYYRRQTAEEREAERQAANRLMLSIQAEAMTKTLYPAAVTTAPPPRSSSQQQHERTSPPATQVHRPGNSPTATSLNALQSLQPWAESASESATSPPGYHHWTYRLPTNPFLSFNLFWFPIVFLFCVQRHFQCFTLHVTLSLVLYINVYKFSCPAWTFPFHQSASPVCTSIFFSLYSISLVFLAVLYPKKSPPPMSVFLVLFFSRDLNYRHLNNNNNHNNKNLAASIRLIWKFPPSLRKWHLHVQSSGVERSSRRP